MSGKCFTHLVGILRAALYFGEISPPLHSGSDPGTGGPGVAHFDRRIERLCSGSNLRPENRGVPRCSFLPYAAEMKR
jgi:hypothetical protein